jgi:hypothetical protein
MRNNNHKSIYDVSNPYDWSRPVQSKKSFAGREEQLSRIENIFAAVKDNLAINVSLTGKRASGKTSMLNAIKHISQDKGGIAVNIDLNENLIRSTIDFWAEVFDNIINLGIPKGLWSNSDDMDGHTSPFFKSWRNNIDLNQISTELESQGIRFGDIYANAKSTGHDAIARPSVIQKDLEYLTDELRKCDVTFLAILVDEADLFIENMGLMQQIRNIMQNLHNVIFVFAGTEKMFDALDDVFSPIPRQFEKIMIDNFQNLSETRDCVFKPLEALGVRRHEIEQYLSYSLLSELHERSDGNPYHLKLLLHYTFENFLLKADKLENNFSIDTNILSKVFRHISQATKQQDRDIVTKLNSCNEEELKAIGFLFQYNGLTISEAAELRNAFFRSSEESIRNHIDHIIGQIKLIDHYEVFYVNKCLKFDEMKISYESASKCKLAFRGDHLDILFLDYYLQEKLNLSLPIKKQWLSYEDALFKEFVDQLGSEIRLSISHRFGELTPPIFIQSEHENMSTAKYEKLRDESLNTILSEIYSALENAENLEIAYKTAKDFGLLSIVPFIFGYNACVIVQISGSFRSSKYHLKVFQPLDISEEKYQQLSDLQESYKEFEPKALLFSHQDSASKVLDPAFYGIHQEKIQWITINNMFMALIATLDIQEKEQLVLDYVLRGEYNKALRLLKFTSALATNTTRLNNLSFVYMVLDDMDEAKKYLDLVLEAEPGLVVAKYNRAYIHYYDGNIPVAERMLKQIVKDFKSINPEIRNMYCLKIIQGDSQSNQNRDPDWDLAFQPDIVSASHLCLASISSLNKSPMSAAHHLKKAEEIGDGHLSIMRATAWNSYQEGKIENAIGIINMLLKEETLDKYMLKEQIELDLAHFEK